VGGVLIAICCARFVAAQPRVSATSVGIAAVALLAFGLAAALPPAVSFAGHGIVQPSNIYALSKIPFALELASEDDVDRMPDAFTSRYLAAMLTARDAGPRPMDINRSLARNQNIAIQACDKVGEQQRLELLCADGMNKVANAVLSRHYGAYVQGILLPAIGRLGRQHVGGSIEALPVSFLVCLTLIVLLAFIAPWLALWGAAILIMEASLVLLLAGLAGPFGYYLVTTEPVFLSALAVMALAAARGGLRSRVGSGTHNALGKASPTPTDYAGPGVFPSGSRGRELVKMNAFGRGTGARNRTVLGGHLPSHLRHNRSGPSGTEQISDRSACARPHAVSAGHTGDRLHDRNGLGTLDVRCGEDQSQGEI
jgi:hypothetical protein